MNTLKRIFSRIASKGSGMGLIISTIIIGFVIVGSPMREVLASAHISVWWPINNVTLGGVQPFKALVDGVSTQSYSMFWQVDNGQLNSMDTNNTDYPHKEALVDVTGWKWQPSGAYNVNFVAKDPSGNVIATSPVLINANVNQGSSLPPINPVSPTNPTTPTNPTIPVTPVVPIIPVVQSVSVWWPTNGAIVTGTQPFKALVDNMPVSNYQMYWSVDGGQLNPMSVNNTDYPHMETTVGLSGWTWKGAGPYSVAFIAKNSSGAEIARKTINIYTGSVSTGSTGSTGSGSTGTATGSTGSSGSGTTPPTNPVTPPTTVNSGDPLSGSTFYVDPNSNAANQARSWASSNPTGSALMTKIATQSAAKWLGNWNGNIFQDTKNYVDAAASAGQVPVMIAYNIPQRDCGGYSAGGSGSASSYQTWISQLAAGIGSRKAIVVLEPDSLAMIDCLNSTDQAMRYSLLNYAVNALKANANTIVYLDAGHSNWVDPTVMSQRLSQANIGKANGFALNVSNFYTTTDQISYGQTIASKLGNKHFIVDTSRNGLGPLGSEWCNPSGRALGTRPTTSTGNSIVDAFLWLKAPGESDGTCNGGPSAGTWWPDYALGLSQRAAY